MSIFDPAARARSAHEADVKRRLALETSRDALASSLTGSVEYEARLDLKRRRHDLDMQVEAAREAEAHSARVLERAMAAAKEKEADARHAAAEREAEAGKKRVRAILAKLDALVGDDLEWLREHKAKTASVNADRGPRPYIADAEERVRRQPVRTIPAVYEEREAWVRQSDGARPMTFVTNRAGALVPQEAGFERVREWVRVQQERAVGGTMPESLLTALLLVDSEGRRTWPR